MFAGFALLPMIAFEIVSAVPLMFLFKGVILNVSVLDSAIGPLLIPLTVNLIFPSVSTPAAEILVVLKDKRSEPPSSVPTASILSSL